MLRNADQIVFLKVSIILLYLYFQAVPQEPFVPLSKEEKTEVERAFNTNRYDSIHILLVNRNGCVC